MLGPAAPTLVEKVPAGQSEHAAEPGSALNLPAAQAAHCPPFTPEKPGMQAQLLADALAGGDDDFGGHVKQALGLVAATPVENLPAEQPEHTAEPGDSLNLPAAQASQMPPVGPE